MTIREERDHFGYDPITNTYLDDVEEKEPDTVFAVVNVATFTILLLCISNEGSVSVESLIRSAIAWCITMILYGAVLKYIKYRRRKQRS